MASISDHRGTIERYERAFRAAPMGVALVCTAEPRLGSFVEVNPEFAAMFGYEPGDLTDRSMRDLTHPGDLARSDSSVEQLFEGESGRIQLEKRFVRKDGSVFWGLSVTSLVTDDGEDGPRLAVVHVKDISSRKRAEAELERRRLQLEQAQRHASIGSFELGFQPDTAWLSDEMYRILGYDRAQPPPSVEEHLASVQPDDRLLLRNALHAWHRPHIVEYRFWRPDGRMVVLDATAAPVLDEAGRPSGMAGTIRDVTQQRALEGALVAAERIQSAFEVSPLAQILISLDEGPGTIAYANAAAASVAGRPAAALAGTPLAKLTGRCDLPPGLRTVLRGDATHFDGAFTLECADGSLMSVHARAEVVAGGNTGRAFILLALREQLTAGTEPADVTAEGSVLSNREREVLELVAEGSAGADIARRLHLSPETVKTHLRRIYLKLGVSDRAAAVAVALRRSLIR